jgi:hypothetical protein
MKNRYRKRSCNVITQRRARLHIENGKVIHHICGEYGGHAYMYINVCGLGRKLKVTKMLVTSHGSGQAKPKPGEAGPKLGQNITTYEEEEEQGFHWGFTPIPASFPRFIS